VLTVGKGKTCVGLATAGGTPDAELTGVETPAGTRETGGTGTVTPWLGPAPMGATVRGCRGVAVYVVDAGSGIPFPGLIPGDWRISGPIAGAASTGALAMALAGIATILD
jgi:hypothetical protein